ncbi:MAG: hypothetical protein M1831_002340 [Alyxoria varia]|nr:MAG: hypothetical protein M1831_002340 [Alyxoria varia]
MGGVLERLDAQLELFLSNWNLWSTILVLSLLALIIYPLFASVEPDTHPFLLSRQASYAPVRQPGESAIYRSHEVPHGFPLKSGLSVKDKGTSKWVAGRDGDIRDIWHKAASGPMGQNGEPTGESGKLMTVFGKMEVEQHDFTALSQQINGFGTYVKRHGGETVAIYLPNSIELLVSLFACAFYGLHPVLIPYGQSPEVTLNLMRITNAEILVANAGSVSVADLRKQSSTIKQVIWVVEKTSRSVDWSDDANGTSEWHRVVGEPSDTFTGSADLPQPSPGDKVPDIVTIWLNDTPSSGEIISFTQQNVASAVAAHISALPPNQRFSSSDLYLPADSLAQPYILTQTLAALYSNASIALNSVAGPNVDLPLATEGVSPTIIAVAPQSALKLHKATSTVVQNSAAKRLAHSSQTSALERGFMPPTTSLMARVNSPTRALDAPRLRLLYVYERANASTPPLSPKELSDLRAFTGARVVYGLTAAKVAGPVTQTNVYDYRAEDTAGARHSHFGVPLSCIEAKVVDTKTHKTEGDGMEEGSDYVPKGEIVVIGPAVSGSAGSGEDSQTRSANLGVLGTFREDGTLAYLQ